VQVCDHGLWVTATDNDQQPLCDGIGELNNIIVMLFYM